MIFLFAGDDAKSKYSSYEEFIKTVSRERDVVFVGRNNFDSLQIESFYSGANLFSPLSAVVFENILDYPEKRDFILEKLPLLAESSNFFIFLEGKLGKPITDVFKKVRAELNVFELPKAKKEKFDNFLVANAFEKKDKLHTWIYFREAMDKGVGMEEIIGVLFWKIKNMLLRKSFGKFSAAELEDYASRLSYLLPRARKKNEDAEAAFEQFLLEAF